MVEVQETCHVFAKKLFDVIANLSETSCASPGNSTIISPISIQTSLAFAFMGAAGTTANELQQALQLESDERPTIAKGFHEFWTKHCKYGANMTLKAVNRLFVNENLTLTSDFNELSKSFCVSKIEKLNFSNANEATQRINALVEQDTENKIKNLLQSDAVNAETDAVLINALYFKGKFEKPFTPESTMGDDFYVDGKKCIHVDMMYQEDKFLFVDLPDINARAVQLPYQQSDISLLIILPNSICGVAELEQKLKTIDLCALESSMEIEDVEIALPRFTIEFDLDLKDALQKLGISEIFGNAADLSRLFETDTGHKISAAKHRGYIDVNEAGSEAAAVSFLKVVPMSLNMQKITFKVDHPFVFFIRNSKAVFFSGRYVGPQDKEIFTCEGHKKLSGSMVGEQSTKES